MLISLFTPLNITAATAPKTYDIETSSVSSNIIVMQNARLGGNYLATPLVQSVPASRLNNSLTAVNDEVNLSDCNITIDQLYDIFDNTVYSNPKFFYFNYYSYSYNLSTKIITKVYLYYNYTKSEILNMNTQYESAITSALSYVKSEMSDAEKVTAIHDFLVLNAKYDYENFLNDSIPRLSYTSYGILVSGIGVCNGYALAFKDLMTRLNIEVLLVSSSSMNHAWNMVKLDGKWYHVDVTWDDPIYSSDNGWENNDYDLEGRVNHEYLLISDEKISSLEHYGWQSDAPTADSIKYQEQFANIQSGMFYDDGYWHYIIWGNLTRSLFDMSNSSTLKAINYDSYIYLINNKLYYNFTNRYQNTSQIRTMNCDGSADTAIITIDSSNKTIFEKIIEFKIQNNSLKYTVYREPIVNETDKYVVRFSNLLPIALKGTIIGAQIVGDVLDGSIDPHYIPTITISMPTSTTTIKSSDFVAGDSGVISFYTTSDFSEVNKVSNNGISISGNSITLYTKVVSSGSYATKYYKMVFNVINAAKKYAISYTNFIKMGSNFVANVTIDRGQALTLANPKLLLIYILADGETQVFLSQNALIGANEVVVGAGVLSVTAVLVDGNVDWSVGNPVSKSAFINMLVPGQ